MLLKLQVDLTKLSSKEAKLLDVLLAENITKETYEQKMLEIRNERVTLEAEIKKQKALEPVIALEPVKKIFEQGITMQNEFLNGDDERKHLILKTALWNLSVKGKEIVTKQYKSPYNILTRTPKNITISNLLGCKDSNLN